MVASALIVIGALLLGACSGATDGASADAAGPTLATSSPALPSTETEPTPTAPPTAPPDPSVIPEDPADIDVAYMQAVVDVFTANEGDIVREAVQSQTITDRLVNLIDRAYSEELRDRELLAWQDDLSDGQLDGLSASPGDPIWTVEEAHSGSFPCVGLRVMIDRNPTASGQALEGEEAYLLFSPREESNQLSPWQLDGFLVSEGTEPVGDPCAAG